MDDTFPVYLQSYSDLRDHFETQFDSLSPRERGQRFVKVVQGLIPYTTSGNKGFQIPELQQESHDQGVDLVARHATNNDVLCIQSKYTIADKAALDTIISKFQGFSEKYSAQTSGPLFASSGVTVEGEPSIYFQIIALNQLSTIIKRYEESRFSSLQFYRQLQSTNRLEIIDGPKIFELLRTAYRKANILPSDFELHFSSDIIVHGNVYIGILSGEELRRLYALHRDALFYENVRNFIAPRNRPASESGTSINEEIIKTARQTPDQFLPRNNGVVIRAQEVFHEGARKLRLRNSSVVNGCQTTVCVVNYTSPDNEVHVMAKVVSTDEAWDVARAANLQNEVTRFELEIAQFIRPQLVNKVASTEGYRAIGSNSAFSLLDSIYEHEVAYEDLRALFVGVFSRTPHNIFSTSYSEIQNDLLAKFYDPDPGGNDLLAKLFPIQQASSQAIQAVQERIQEKGIPINAYQRFFKEDKAAYRAFFTLLAASSVSGIDLSQRTADLQSRYEMVNRFLDGTLEVIQNTPEEFARYYRFAMHAVSSSIPPEKDADSAKQLIWQVVKRANFSQLLERMKLSALNSELG
jgi:hypothetical protein